MDATRRLNLTLPGFPVLKMKFEFFADESILKRLNIFELLRNYITVPAWTQHQSVLCILHSSTLC